LDQAITYYEKEIENDPLEYKASFNAAVVWRRQGRYDRAIPFYRKTIEANPRFNVPYFMIANYYFEQDTNLPEAIELCKNGIDVAPEEESTLFGYQVLLRLLQKTGDGASFDFYTRKANDLFRKLEQTKKN
jgi:tetratricopeptide (TPR) repeat protein